MRKVIYSMLVSLDGFIEGPNGEHDWLQVDEEFHRFANRREADVGVHVLGRRMYEVMRFWDTADKDPASTEVELEFARLWQATPKLVFSTTLEHVGENAQLASGDLAEAITRLKEQPGKDISVGGPDLAATLMRLDLIDEYQVFVQPIIVGRGKSMFAEMDRPVQLRLLETRTFASGVIWLRYERVGQAKGGSDHDRD